MSSGALAVSGPVVFVSYSREDEQWRRRFTEMLKPLVRERRLEVWSDDRMVVGYRWRLQLEEAIARSRAALLLVSSAFLASDFIMEQELPTLIEQGVRLVPVLVRPCLWQAAPVLEGLQWAHDPGRDGPVAGSPTRRARLSGCACSCASCWRRTEPQRRRVTRVVLPPAASRTVPLAAGQRLGELYGVPLPPPAFVARGSWLACARRCWGRAMARWA